MPKSDEKEKVLVVDNHPLIIKFVSGLLEKNGYLVETAADGLSALDVLTTFSPDYIILDLVMPNINGASLCRIIRADARFANTSIFILSAAAAEISGCTETFGADRCIAKGPFPEMGEHLLQALRQQKSPGGRAPETTLGLETTYPRGITRELLDANHHLGVIVGSIIEGIVELNEEERILLINRAAAEFFSEPEQSLLGRNFISLFREEDRQFVSVLLESDVRVASANSVELGGRFLSIRAVPIELEQKNRIVVINDVTQAMKTREALEKANEALETLSRTDPLSGLANRRWFDERIQREWRRMQREKKPITILLCDVDLFKQFNDRFGHPAGDDCLRFVADRLTELAKRPADLAARFGGDEFAVIFPDTHEQGAGHLARTLKAGISTFDFSDIATGEKAAIALSIGTATAYPGESRTPERLISLADEALYKAKKAGRNRIVSLTLDP